MLKNKTILVTGSTGFIGKNLVKSLEENGAIVIGLSSQHDLRKKEILESFHGKVEHVIHSAGKVFVPDSWNKPEDFLEVNVDGTRTVLEFCRKNSIGCSYISGYVYGAGTPLPIQENALIRPSNPYAFSKYLGEQVCQMYHELFKVPVQIIRPFNVYGENQPEMFLIPHLLKQFKESSSVKVKDLEPKRDYIHVKDLSELVLLTCMRKDFNIFNAGTGHSTSVKELIDLLAEISGKKLPVENENQTRKNEIDDSVADISHARNVLGWSPSMPISKGLEQLYKS